MYPTHRHAQNHRPPALHWRRPLDCRLWHPDGRRVGCQKRVNVSGCWELATTRRSSA